MIRLEIKTCNTILVENQQKTSSSSGKTDKYE